MISYDIESREKGREEPGSGGVAAMGFERRDDGITDGLGAHVIDPEAAATAVDGPMVPRPGRFPDEEDAVPGSAVDRQGPGAVGAHEQGLAVVQPRHLRPPPRAAVGLEHHEALALAADQQQLLAAAAAAGDEKVPDVVVM